MREVLEVTYKEKRTVDGPIDIAAVDVSPVGTTYGFCRGGICYRTSSTGPFTWVMLTTCPNSQWDLNLPERVVKILQGYIELEESEATDGDQD